MFRGFLLLIFALNASIVSAQDLDWVKPYSADSFCSVRRIGILPNDAAVILGEANGELHMPDGAIHNGSKHYYDYLIKYDADGTPVWSLFPQPDSTAFIYDMQVDDSGNIYVIGRWSGTMTIGRDTFVSADSATFLARLDSDGKVIWLRKAPGLSYYASIRIASGKIFMEAFTRRKSVQIEDGAGTGSYALEYENNYAFVSYSDNGQLLWAKFFGGSSRTYFSLQDWETDGSSIYAVASPDSGFDVKPGNGETIVGTARPFIMENIFLLKYSGTGDLVWLKTLQRNNSNVTDGINSISFDLDKEDNIILSTTYSGRVDFDFSDKTYFLTSSSSYFDRGDYAVAKYDSAFNLKWAFSIHNGSVWPFWYTHNVKVVNESIYTYGVYYRGMDLDPGPGTYVRLNGQNHFFAEYDLDGKFMTARIFGGSEDKSQWYASQQSLFFDFEVDKHRNIYVCGIASLMKDFDFDPSKDSLLLDSTDGLYKGYVAKYVTCKKPVQIIPSYREDGCRKWVSSLTALNDHYPVKWYDGDGSQLYEGAQYSLPPDAKSGAYIAEDGCGYSDTFILQQQPRWNTVKKVYPNPSRGDISVTIDGASANVLHVELINSLGQRVYSTDYAIREGIQDLTLPTRHLKPGLYYLATGNDCSRQVEKIMLNGE